MDFLKSATSETQGFSGISVFAEKFMCVFVWQIIRVKYIVSPS